VNAVLQLLVHSPPFWNLFGELGDLKGLRGEVGLESSGGATPLLDATVRFIDEFTFKENEPPPIQRPHEQAAGAEPREDKEAKKGHNSVDSFEPTYMYDAMKEKRQLKNLLVRSRAWDTPFCY
jgi:ubiquitin carboxyl-terminal hydrolase 10